MLIRIPTDAFCETVLQFLPSALRAIEATASRKKPQAYLVMVGMANRARRAMSSATKRAAAPSRSDTSCHAMTTAPHSPARAAKELKCSG